MRRISPRRPATGISGRLSSVSIRSTLRGLLGVWFTGGRGDRFHFSSGEAGRERGDRVIMTRIAINNNGQCRLAP